MPTPKQMAQLGDTITNLIEIGDFDHYPIAHVVDSELLESHGDLIELNQCYDNCAQILFALVHSGFDSDHVKYCVGVTKSDSGILPLPHAWLKINGSYVDPTFELVQKTYNHDRDYTHYLMAELTARDVSRLVEVNGHRAPCPVAVMRFAPKLLRGAA